MHRNSRSAHKGNCVAGIVEPHGLPRSSDGRLAAWAFDRGPDLLGLICFVFGEQIVARLDTELSLNASDGSAISSTDRAAQMEAIEASILVCERDEEELILAAEQSGQEIARRIDADPRAILGVV